MVVSNAIRQPSVPRSTEMVSDWLPRRIAEVWEKRPKGMQQKDLEQKIGLKRGAFHTWRDTDREKPVVPPLERIEAFMGAVEGQFIFELVPPGEDKRELVPLDPATAEVARAVMELPPAARKWLLRLVRVYARLDQYEPLLHQMITQTESRARDEAR
jgi:hypothetical protein